MMADVSEGFYEDDEPLADVLEAFGRGVKNVTVPPVPGGGVAAVAACTYVAAHTERRSAGAFEMQQHVVLVSA